MASWCPPAHGAIAVQVTQIVRRIAIIIETIIGEALPSLERSTSQQTHFRVSLANGMAGIAIFYAALYKATSDDHWLCLARRYVGEAVIAMASVGTRCSLYEGYVGVAWASRFLDSFCGSLTEEEKYGDIENAILRHLGVKEEHLNYDVMSGIVGIGLYGMAAASHESGVECINRVIDRLISNVVEEKGLPTWSAYRSVHRERDGSGNRRHSYNLGMAHGVPSIISFLAKALGDGHHPGGLREIVGGSISWLMAQAFESPRGSMFPGYIDEGRIPVASRLSWCYGDLSVAMCILQAASHLHAAAWRSEAIEIALGTLGRCGKSERIIGPAFCHGSAGIMHQYNRLFNATSNKKFKSACLYWLDETLTHLNDRRNPICVSGDKNCCHVVHPWTGDLGLLNGLAGIGLALMAATNLGEPDWDVLFLLDVTPDIRGQRRKTLDFERSCRPIEL